MMITTYVTVLVVAKKMTLQCNAKLDLIKQLLSNKLQCDDN
jgi:hypothetical protein